MKEVIQEVGSFVFMGVIAVIVIGMIQHFFPNLIESINQYLSGRTPKY